MTMFTNKDISNIDREYFKIIATSPFAITIESEATTHHQWHLISKQQGKCESCEVYHRHKSADPWHRQWAGRKYPNVFDDIKEHDRFRMNGRPNHTE